VSRIRVLCRHCGHVVVPGDAIDLLIWSDEPDPEPSYYSFRCTTCALRTVMLLDEPQLQLLLAHGARVRRYGAVRRQPSPSPALPPPQPGRPPLTHDDLLDLHLLLEQPDWWDHLLAAGEGRPRGAPGGQVS